MKEPMIAQGQRALLAALALSLVELVGLVGLVGLLGPLGCVAGATERPPGVPEPPAPLPELRSAPPTPRMVWIAGAWHWDGVAYVWVPGRWESPPPIPEAS